MRGGWRRGAVWRSSGSRPRRSGRQRGAQLARDGGRVHLQAAGDLLLREPLHVMEQHDLALVGGQRQDRAAQPGRFLFVFQHRTGSLRGGVGEVFGGLQRHQVSEPLRQAGAGRAARPSRRPGCARSAPARPRSARGTPGGPGAARRAAAPPGPGLRRPRRGPVARRPMAKTMPWWRSTSHWNAAVSPARAARTWLVSACSAAISAMIDPWLNVGGEAPLIQD